MENDRRRGLRIVYFLLNTLLVCLPANCVLLWDASRLSRLYGILIVLFLAANVMPSLIRRGLSPLRLRLCAHGAACLRVFLASAAVSLVFHVAAAFRLFPQDWKTWVLSAVVCICAEAILFWNGMTCVYCTSYQLGIRQRVTAALLGLVPVANFFALRKIIRTVSDEVDFEAEKAKLDAGREAERVCRTKYPILLVHGVFFRDYKFPNYWGRIPAELERNGAVIYYGNHQSAAAVSDSAAELTARIGQIVQETGCGKVNIIAHSKGGLDCRYALSHCGAGPYVASLTTINTPHRGCEFADYLLEKIPRGMQETLENTYNAAMKKLGDSNPDFMAAVRDLPASRCLELNREMPTPDGILCQSVGSKLNSATNGKFPLNFTYALVKYFDGPNDGLVSESSFSWGSRYTFLTTDGKRGISHGDVIDLNRENIPGFDVREFYVQLAAELKQQGL